MASLHVFDVVTIAVYFLIVIGFGIWVIMIIYSYVLRNKNVNCFKSVLNKVIV